MAWRVLLGSTLAWLAATPALAHAIIVELEQRKVLNILDDRSVLLNWKMAATFGSNPLKAMAL